MVLCTENPLILSRLLFHDLPLMQPPKYQQISLNYFTVQEFKLPVYNTKVIGDYVYVYRGGEEDLVSEK